MNPSESLKPKLLNLRRLVDFQRLVRYGLRAGWLMGAGFLAGWAIQALNGLLPDARLWLLIGLVPALVSLAVIFWKRPTQAGFVWRLDRRLGLKEQLSTASSATLAGGAGNPVLILLQQEALGLVPGIQKRILKRGWRISGELLSLGVVMALGLGIYFGEAPAPEAPVNLTPGERLSLPSFQPQEATLQQVLPQGVLSLNPNAKSPDSQQAAGSSGNPSSSTPSQQPGSSGSANPSSPSSGTSGTEALSQALQQAGQALSQQASSYELGQALQNQDLSKAADQLEQLADKLGSLSQPSRDQLAKSLSQAASSLPPPPQNPATSPQNTAISSPTQATQKLAQDLNQAAQSLHQAATDASGSQPGQAGQPSTGGSPRDAMDAIAGDLRNLAAAAQMAQQSAGGGAGLGGGGPKLGPPEALTRLQGESGDFKLDLNDPALAGILVPGQPLTAAGSTVASGSTGTPGTPSDTASRGVLFPYSYPYQWQALIAQYFQRGN